MAGAHIALIRGINVGKAKRVAMADLRALVEELGCRDVRTLLNSGNVVFTVPASFSGEIGVRIEAAMAERLGVSARVMVLTAAELTAVVAENPLLDLATDHSRLLVGVLGDTAAIHRAQLEELARQDWASEALALGGRTLYLWCPNGVLKSRLAADIGRVLGDTVTMRNWATISKLHALMGD